MAAWRPQLFQHRGRVRGVNQNLLDHAIAIGRGITAVNPTLPPIFTLKHLAWLTDVDYGLLRAIVTRSLENPYRVFRIRKRPSHIGENRFRIICVPDPALMQVQRWIAQNVLAKGSPHAASVAYAPGN